MIEFENVSFSYDGQEHDGLQNINLKIADGECVLFCGRSGCGKTTITRLVDGIQEKAITNMAKDQYMDMGLAMLNSPKTMEDGDFIELSGEIYQGKFEEFYPDMDELKEIVINLFYKEKA